MVNWKRQVKARDKGACQLCGSKQFIHIHHIRRFSDAPSLRFNVNNGICLCRKCHQRVTGREEAYAPLFIKKVYFNKTGKNLDDVGQKSEGELELKEIKDDQSCNLPVSESFEDLEDHDED